MMEMNPTELAVDNCEDLNEQMQLFYSFNASESESARTARNFDHVAYYIIKRNEPGHNNHFALAR